MSNIPNCPITRSQLVDPVMDPEGNSYSRHAIVEWLSNHHTSPITRTPLTVSQLVPNRAMQDMIEEANKLQRPSVLDSTHGPLVDVSEITVTTWASKSPLDSTDVTGFTVHSPDYTHVKLPIHICCVIDVSGSMATSCEVKTATGQSESDGLTILDLVKHATRVIIESLSDNDKLSLVAFTTDSRIVLHPTIMTDDGKRKARNELELLLPDSSTNLAAGVRHGVQVSAQVGKAYISSIFVLTDGVPSDSNLDYKGALQRQLAKDLLYGNLHTFGFGYALDSALLKVIAREGDGSFAFIPDAGMVGTVFINALSNVRCAYASRVSLELTMSAECVGGLRSVKNAVMLPPLRFGKDVSFIVHGVHTGAKLKMTLAGGKEVVMDVSEQVPSSDEHRYQVLRATIADALFKAATSTFSAPAPILLNDPPQIQGHLAVHALLEDINGQVKEALTRQDYFDKWGKHYLISLAFAHLHQRCNNFKDPGVQVYGGKMFKQTQDELNDLFLALPAPVPTGYRGSVSSSQPVDMNRYNNASGWCFSGECLVSLDDGVCKLKELEPNMIVMGGGVVKCIVKTTLKERAWFVHLRQMQVTAYHPVMVDGEWRFPCDLAPPQLSTEREMYSVLLEQGNTIEIDGIKAVTLGHGIEEGVAKHDYFGTLSVVQDLQQFPGYDKGFVVLHTEQVRRDLDTGLVCGLTKTASDILV